MVDHTRIQEELIDLQKPISESDAGKTLHYTLRKVPEAQRELAHQLRDEGDAGEKREETANKLPSILNQIRELKR